MGGHGGVSQFVPIKKKTIEEYLLVGNRLLSRASSQAAICPHFSTTALPYSGC
jgi:hypothetical protein